ncbi:MAG: hypothetical protein WAT39_02445 [Planctomycetota bacterium]
MRSVLLAISFSLAGCTMGSSVMNGRATIVPRPLDAAAVAPLRAGTTVAVVAGPASDAWFQLCARGDATQVNLAVLTAETVACVGRELQQRGVTVAAEAKKRLELTVVRASGDPAFMKVRVDVRLRANTGDGQSAEFEGSVSSIKGAVATSEDALSQAVQKLLSDARIRAWLES